MRSGAVGTVERVVCLMRALAEAGGDINIKRLSEQLSLPASTIHRLLGLLLDLGIVERGRQSYSYKAGVEFYRIGALVVGQNSLRDMALPFMERVVAGCGEVCLLMRYMKAMRRIMPEQAVETPHPLRYQVDMYEPLSILWGASGRSVLAFLRQAEIEAVHAEGESSPIGGRPAPTADELYAQLAEIRATGYAISFGEKFAGAVGLGAPVFDADGTVLGSLCVTVPQIRFKPEMEEPIAALILRESQALSNALGYQPMHRKLEGAHG